MVNRFANAGVYLEADLKNYPPTAASFWRLDDLTLAENPCGVIAFGGDTSGGLATSISVTGSGVPDDPRNLEGDTGIVDGTIFGSVWVGCRVEGSRGYPFVANSPVGPAAFIGCYSEGYGLQAKNDTVFGVVVGGGMASADFTSNSFAPILKQRGAYNLWGIDNRVPKFVDAAGESHDVQLHAFLAGTRGHNLGRMALGVTAEGREGGVQGLCWGEAVVDQDGAGLGWPKQLPGWWVWVWRPETYGASYAPFAISGDRAEDPRELRGRTLPAAGQFMFPAGGFHLIRTSNVPPADGFQPPNRFQLADGKPPIPTPGLETWGSGTWLVGDRIWNAKPTFNGPAGWIFAPAGSGGTGTWISLPVAGDPQVVIPMDDADRLLSVEEAAHSIIKVSGTLTKDRRLVFPAPEDDEHAYQRTIRAAVSGGSVLVDIDGGTSAIEVAAGKTTVIGFDSTSAFRVTADA